MGAPGGVLSTAEGPRPFQPRNLPPATTTSISVTMGDTGSVATSGVGTVIVDVIIHGTSRNIM